MEIGIDSFAASPINLGISNAQALGELLERITLADQVGLDVFGIGEHYRKEFLDSAPAIILAAAASRTKRIILTSAVTVLSAADPVRVFQNFSTLDLISNGRAEIVAGRGSFTESYPLFGLNLNDYDALFTEKLDLLLKIRDNEIISWSGKFRPPLYNQAIYPRPLQTKLPIWLGVGGTPASFVRAGKLGLPLMVAVIGGETHRFRPLIDMYRQAWEKAGHAPQQWKVGLHSLGYVANSKEEAISDYYPGYAEMFTKIGKERGYPPVTRERFDAQNGELGALLIDDPEAVAAKILRHSESLGGISRFTFQMDAGLSHQKLMKSIELIGTKVSPLVKKEKLTA
ncbi:MAG: LLM class flavin-dependent oxidoreductase [Saprospiraceae bacterium]|nr:LLM class flavin-dependent oxidoreductase [Saprospiraceae bacterium]